MKSKNVLIIFLIVLAVSISQGVVFLSFGEDAVSSYISGVSQKIAAAAASGQFPKKKLPLGRYRAVVDVSIWKNGKAYIIDVVQSSGVIEFDEEVMDLIRSLSPYPALPEGRKSLKIRLPIEIAGRQETEEKKQEAKDKKQEAGIDKDMEEEKDKADKDQFVKAKTRISKIDKELAKKEKEAKVKKREKTIKPRRPRMKEKLAKAIMSESFLREKVKMKEIVNEADSLYQIALDNSDPAIVAQAQLGLARLKIKDARRNLFPKMEMQYSISEGSTITDPYESKAYAVQLKQNLFDNGKTFKTLRKEKLNREVAEKEYDKTVQELKFEVIRSYLNVLGKTEELAAVTKFRNDVGKDYSLAGDIYKAGAISRVEFVEIEAEYKRAVNMISQIGNELELSKEKLRASMNLGEDEGVPIKERELARLDEMNINVDDCVRLALSNKPEVRLWEISMEAAEYAKDIAGSESAPHFNIVTSYGASGEAFADQNLDLAEEWKVMGVVTWLFGGNSFEVSGADESVSSKEVTELSRKTAVTTYSAKMGVMDKMQYYVQKKEAEIAYAQNISNLSKNKQEVVFDTRKSFLEYRQSFDEYQVALFEDKFSSVNAELKKESFKIGKANLSEVVKTRADHMRKQLALARAKISYYISLASLDKATAYSLGLF
jgi:outer membrane protein